MTDRELLELAAKAAGIKYTIKDDEYYKTHKFFGLWLDIDYEPSEYSRRYWNPLTDDGDALRLAANLGIRIDFQGSSVKANDHVCTALDIYAATRRAVVRAAAEIGRTK